MTNNRNALIDSVFELSKDLAKENCQCHLRSSISRAYYAGYYKARIQSALLPPDDPERKPDQHEEVIARLERSKEHRHKQMAKLLVKSRASRTKADYHLDLQFTREDAQVQIDRVQELMRLTLRP